MSSKNEILVLVAVQGQSPKTVKVSGSATVKSALLAAKLDPAVYAGNITVDTNEAQLTDRVKSGAYISVTPKVAGGLR